MIIFLKVRDCLSPIGLNYIVSVTFWFGATIVCDPFDRLFSHCEYPLCCEIIFWVNTPSFYLDTFHTLGTNKYSLSFCDRDRYDLKSISHTVLTLCFSCRPVLRSFDSLQIYSRSQFDLCNNKSEGTLDS